MGKNHFFIRLIPPRVSFVEDMSEQERALMQEHVLYWQALLRRRIALIFGPVFDPSGGYGAGIIELEEGKSAIEFLDKDPTIRSGLGFRYEVFPMRLVRK
jgi:uncharacterized protein YciI